MFESNFQRVISVLLRDIGTPVSRNVLDKFVAKDWSGLAAISVDPSHYSCPERFFLDYQAVSLVRKLEVPGDKQRLRAVAVKTFWDCEKQCFQTNESLNRFLFNQIDEEGDAVVYEFVHRCKKFIRHVLGPLPKELEVRFGPGATFADRGCLTTIPDKMSSRPTVTSEAAWSGVFLNGTAWERALRRDGYRMTPFEVVRGNRFTTVPKDGTKDRGICVEPSINLAFQLYVGSVMKDRLKRVGLDLRHGQDRHKRLARAASLDGSYATVDLSNASDTVALNLVKLLLPEEWYDLLASLRSPFTKVDGKWVRLEKFSSMGNGFTFELETLIFSSFCAALGCTIGEDTFVYGDDIIVPTEFSIKLMEVLAYFGFTPNMRKTYLNGPFRESCGGDFFEGVDVRPHFQKRIPDTYADWFSFANGLFRVGRRSVTTWYKFRRAHSLILSSIPVEFRKLTGPEGLGDIVLHADQWQRGRIVGGIQYFRTLQAVSTPLPWHHWTPDVQLAAFLYGVPSTGPTPRESVVSYRKRWAAYS